MKRTRVLIMGAAGRDFHNFNVLFRNDPRSEVVAFTAAQIPDIEGRTYPPLLSGKLYPKGIPIESEERLAKIIKSKSIEKVVFSYSDVSHEYVMHRASLVTSLGADFVLTGAEKTMLKSKKPVISVCAVRTGCGKSGVTRLVASILGKYGVKTVVVRHPMPYGNLERQRVQRFSTLLDMKKAKCTIEEMEEYEHLIESGIVVYAGVDYSAILKEAEKEAQVIIWDGGNNDLPFFKPTLEIVVTDPLRLGDELKYYPGEANLIRAQIVIVNKVNTASNESISSQIKNIKRVNPGSVVLKTRSEVKAVTSLNLKKKHVIVIEDGPTLTHGNMSFGAGIVAAKSLGAIVKSPKPYAIGEIKATFDKYPTLTNVIPAMGYSKKQIKDLEKTINAIPAQAVLIATPIDLSKLIKIKKPVVRVRYEVTNPTGRLENALRVFIDKMVR